MRIGSIQIRGLAALCAVALATVVAGTAGGQDLQSQLQHKRDRLGEVKHHEGELSTTIQKYGDQIDELIGQISVLRNRVAVVQEELSQKQAELHRDRIRLQQLKSDLQRSLNALRNRLVDIYRSGQPDLLTVIL